MDRIIEKPEGFYAIVNGKWFGTWRSRAEARAGMQTEQRRHQEREDAESARQMAYVDQTNQEYHERRNGG